VLQALSLYLVQRMPFARALHLILSRPALEVPEVDLAVAQEVVAQGAEVVVDQVAAAVQEVEVEAVLAPAVV
jgi:hypothetical protein